MMDPNASRPWDVDSEIDNEVYGQRGMQEINEAARNFAAHAARPTLNTHENDPSREAARNQLQTFFESVQGNTFIIRHLLSGAGQELNGQVGSIVGHDVLDLSASKFEVTEQMLRARFHLRLNDRTVRIKASNLIRPENFLENRSRTQLDDDDLLVLITTVLERLTEQNHNREDIQRRIRFVKRCLQAKEVPPPLACGSLMIPDHELADHDLIVKSARICRFACSGDSTADLRRFAEGLFAAGELCAICGDPILRQESALRLPCFHIVHSECISPCFEESYECPICQFQLSPDAISKNSYQVPDVQPQILNRIYQWFISGACERCQSAYIENDPIRPVQTRNPDLPDGPPMCILIQQSQLPESP